MTAAIAREATEIIAALMQRSRSAQDTVKHYLARIEQDTDPNNAVRSNAFLSVDRAAALAQADASDRWLAQETPRSAIEGWPIAIKDNIDAAGQPTSAGTAALRFNIAARDADCIAKLRAAGAIFLGKVNLNEGALGADNSNAHFGECHNPLRHGYTPGGSSGGSAAAVAAGLCVAALGTDTMGSVRIPASYCGIVGFKPSFDVISRFGLVTACARLDHVGILSPTVAIAAELFAHMRARALPTAEPYQHARFGVLENLSHFGVQPEVVARFDVAIAALRERGFALQPIAMHGVDFGSARRAGLLATEADMALVHAAHFDQLSPALQSMLQFAKGKSALDLAAAYQRMDAAAERLRACFLECDFLLTPTTPQRAFAHGHAVPANQADLTSLANMAGCPAISLPLLCGADLPCGLQIIAAPAQDLALLALAQSVEALVR
jgi:Asp-tRNA(Asn)/Glu-tRNA(Gln) amidotransferase A subunit family amidase